ncbi:MAG: hypothetical protein QNK36_18220 [Colwellia sp.]|nr:hypothetical protein [Colwellia sp.]
MNVYPPPILVETWLYLTTNHSIQLEHVKRPLHRAIKNFFGSNELARLYIEQCKDEQIEVHFV